MPDAKADEATPISLANQPLLPIAQGALKHALEGPDMAVNATTSMRHVVDNKAYAVTLTPLAFSDWVLATVLPEEEFLGPIEATTRRLAIGLGVALLAFAALSVWLARQMIAAPLARVAGELQHVERFELSQVKRHPSRLAEINALSDAIVAHGVGAFRLRANICRTTSCASSLPKAWRRGRAAPTATSPSSSPTSPASPGFPSGSATRSCRLLGSYLDLLSRTIGEHRGTVDKFIGDAVMAFWGAPRENPEHAAAACRAALACERALTAARIFDDHGRPLRMRIGINSGRALVGNIGSDNRLNYTAIGDTVNIASRLESASKIFGTTIIIGEATRRAAGDSIVVRELDKIAVYGRAEGIAIFELIGLAEEGPAPAWAKLYETALGEYRARAFGRAEELFREVLALRPGDKAAQLMAERCERFCREAPPADWAGTTAFDMK